MATENVVDIGVDGHTVKYGAPNQTDGAQIEFQSPAKNRKNGSSLSRKQSYNRWPSLFERASENWWNPQFDSKILEEQLWKSYFPQTRRQFQYALYFILVACVAWCIFFVSMQKQFWSVFLIGTLALIGFIVVIVIFSFTKYYERFYLQTSVVVLLVLCTLLLSQFAYSSSMLDISTIGSFAGSVEIMLMMYTMIPLPLFAAVIFGVSYSILYEVLTIFLHSPMQYPEFCVGKLLLHLCIHLIGINSFITSQMRKRSTILKIGQSVMARKDLQVEEQLKIDMIHSLMPPEVAKDVMRSRDKDEDDDNDDGRAKKKNSRSKKVKGEIIFRSFNMTQMDNVSILFADIVGFTKMSSNKTAEHLVGLLNTLFGRFDTLCTNSGCEKVSTLGDCYYCVSGCPKARDDHAVCCVTMGIGMIKVIKEFDEEYNESVNMRVGVHTGTVLCGIVGTRRFKFDVWSNDVTLANTMESSGEPGRVHISASCYEYLKHLYEVTPGENVEDNRTYKVLIEDYNTETSSFAVRHTEDQKEINTYFILGPKAKEEDVPILESSPKSNPSDFVAIKLDCTEAPGDASGQVNGRQSRDLEEGKEAPVDDQGGENLGSSNVIAGSNGVSPASPLDHRQNSSLLNNSESSLAQNQQKESESKEAKLIPAVSTYKKEREQNDKLLVRFIQEGMQEENYFKKSLNICTLNFNSELEPLYRQNWHQVSQSQTTDSTKAQGIPKFHSLLEVGVSFAYFLIISICCFIMFDRKFPWIVVFVVSLLILLTVMIQLLLDVRYGSLQNALCNSLGKLLSGWYMRNFVGTLLATLPVVAVYSNFCCSIFDEDSWRDQFYCYCIIVSLLQYCNFSMISSWGKTSLAILAGLVLLVLLFARTCPIDTSEFTNNALNVSTNALNVSTNASDISASSANNLLHSWLFSGIDRLRFEIILDILLILVMIWFLNREFEFGSRLSFYVDYQANEDKRIMQENKDQAEWLLHNIIPQHISEQMKKNSKYSKNHKNVGVIFATIVNFNEFYDESYKGGREYLRVLNELISDYEVLLDEHCFKDVEKIKTITSTFMAASGLNIQSRLENKHPHAHLFSLIDFSIEMQNVVGRFNESIFNFDFILNIGYNFGEVTAGVIGTTKLLYDIWGDTVNISSRMYSTGPEGRIQVPESNIEILSEMFELEYRGMIQVKGKGDMKTYLIVRKKPGAFWE